MIVSDSDEYVYYKNMDLGISIVNAPNEPLGLKWQAGVERCKGAEALIICGSDDILGPGFIEQSIQLLNEGNHFIGLRSWYQHYEGKAYLCQYLAKENIPIGGGRVFSSEMLRKLRYTLFDSQRNKHLDDLAWISVKQSGLKALLLQYPNMQRMYIHAIKGNWQMLNPFTLKHKNIRLMRTEQAMNVLPEFYLMKIQNKENGNSFGL